MVSSVVWERGIPAQPMTKATPTRVSLWDSVDRLTPRSPWSPLFKMYPESVQFLKIGLHPLVDQSSEHLPLLTLPLVTWVSGAVWELRPAGDLPALVRDELTVELWHGHCCFAFSGWPCNWCGCRSGVAAPGQGRFPQRLGLSTEDAPLRMRRHMWDEPGVRSERLVAGRCPPSERRGLLALHFVLSSRTTVAGDRVGEMRDIDPEMRRAREQIWDVQSQRANPGFSLETRQQSHSPCTFA